MARFLRWLPTVVFAAVSFPAHADPPPPDWSRALAAVDALAKGEAAKVGGPSFSIAVVSRRHPAYFVSYGYADTARKTPADAHTVYEIGSITKLFTGTMLMQLRDAGKASLDDPLTGHLPEFSMPSPFGGQAAPTLRQLVTHTSGLPRSLPKYSEFEAPGGSEAELLAELKAASAVLPPFTRFKYSNLGVGLAGYALARTAGMPWADYIERKILQPLDMAETWAVRAKMPAAMAGRAAVGYVPVADGWRPAAMPLTLNRLNEAAGAILSTAADMAKFVAWQLDESDDRVLSALSRREMRVPLWMNGDWNSGNGVAFMLSRQDGEILAGHGGGTVGFSSMLNFDPRLGVGIVVLGNGMTDAQGLAGKMMAPLIAAARVEAAAEDAARPKPPLPDDAAALAGTYAHDYAMLLPLQVSVENGGLVARSEDLGNLRLEFAGRLRAFVIDGNSMLDGETVAFESDGGTMRLSVGHGSIVFVRKPEKQSASP